MLVPIDFSYTTCYRLSIVTFALGRTVTSQTVAVTTEIPLPVRLGNWVIATSQFYKLFDRVRLAIGLRLHNFRESP